MKKECFICTACGRETYWLNRRTNVWHCDNCGHEHQARLTPAWPGRPTSELKSRTARLTAREVMFIKLIRDQGVDVLYAARAIDSVRELEGFTSTLELDLQK